MPAGDVATNTEIYRIVFRNASRIPGLADRIADRLRAHFTPETVLASDVIENRLYRDTLEAEGYDAVGQLGGSAVPTLVVHGSHDFVPVRMAERIAAEIPGARLEVLPDCGHFSYAEHPESVRDVICPFLAS